MSQRRKDLRTSHHDGASYCDGMSHHDGMSLSLFFPPCNQLNLQSESLSRRVLDQFDELNPAVTSFVHGMAGSGSTGKSIQNSGSKGILPQQTSPPSITITIYNQNA